MHDSEKLPTGLTVFVFFSRMRTRALHTQYQNHHVRITHVTLRTASAPCQPNCTRTVLHQPPIPSPTHPPPPAERKDPSNAGNPGSYYTRKTSHPFTTYRPANERVHASLPCMHRGDLGYESSPGGLGYNGECGYYVLPAAVPGRILSNTLQKVRP